jgi:FkbM family methyltransferase
MPESAYRQINTPQGNPLRVRCGNNDGFWDSYESGAWEPDTLAIFRRLIDENHSYVDIGAWIGPTLLLGCQLAKRAYGIEPDPIAFAELSANIDSNRPLTSNVHLFNLCITPASGKVPFGSRCDGGDSMSSLLFSREKTCWTVEGKNFQEWIEQNEVNDCSFVKIDIEGGEYVVLPTMMTYARTYRPTIQPFVTPGFCRRPTRKWYRGKAKAFCAAFERDSYSAMDVEVL